MSLSQYGDLELLGELIRRNGTDKAPWRVVRSAEYLSSLVPIGKDHTAEIVLLKEALPHVA